MKYCVHCGKELADEAVICVGCGCAAEMKNAAPYVKNQDSGLGLAAKILMIISCVVLGWTIIPLAWLIPMTVSLSGKLKRGEPISVGFKVCVLIFANMISGILLLCMDD